MYPSGEMMKPDPPLTWRRSSSSSSFPLPRGFCGFGKKSNGSMPNGCIRRRSLVFTTSVVVIETTAGMTRAATSANDGIVTAVTAPCAVWIGAVCCAFDLRIMPRSALMITPKATEAMMIASVDRMRLVD
jgi:hypothetical protein